jgi:hypothetical protein
MEQLSNHKNVYDKLNCFYKSGKIPHIIFHGYSGSGKKTILNWFINKIYNKDKTIIKSNVMSVNCAHGKGIRFIREDLKFFAKTNIQSDNGTIFKSIILLNADFLTIDAQSALRRCIELFSYNTRFLIVVENKDKLLKPILSRFCEIYIPEYVEDNVVKNLHSHFMQQKSIINDSDNIQYIYTKLKDLDSTQITHNDLIALANDFYENGYSGLDLIDCVMQTGLFDKKKSSSIVVCFNIIKSEYRCENLLMLYMLDYMYLRSKTEIKSVLTL